jgi:tetratricopeptide (TPR) repeat protein
LDLLQHKLMQLFQFIRCCGLLAIFFTAGQAWSADAMSRQQALNALTSQVTNTKLSAINRLAKVGQIKDSNSLVSSLRDVDPSVGLAANAALWEIWARANDKAADKLYQKGIAQMSSGQSLQAITTFSEIIRLKPDFAEAWNKRATVYYFVGDLQKSLADCDEVMKRNPNHFGALSGYGQIYAQMGDFDQALRYFEKAYAINPTMLGVAQTIKDIRKLQEREGARRT